MRSRLCPSRLDLSSMATSSRKDASRSAASRTSHGAIQRPKRLLRGQPANAATFARAADDAAARRQRLRPQHLQDRTCAPRYRARAHASRAWHAAIAVVQESHLRTAMAPYIGSCNIPHRRRRESHRRGKICRRIQRAGPPPRQHRRLDDYERPHHAHRHERREARQGRDRRVYAR